MGCRAAVKQGAQRGCDLEERRSAADTASTTLIGRMRAMRELSRMHDQWRELHDETSGLPATALVYDRLHQALLLARREPLAVTLMMLSWPELESADATTELDALAAARIAASVRGSDTVGWVCERRLAVMLPNANDEDVPFVASRLMVRLIAPFDVRGEQVVLRSCAGVAVAGTGQFVPDAQELMRQADLALAEARRRGGGFAAYETPESQALVHSISASA